jgi:hypothetical protein
MSRKEEGTKIVRVTGQGQFTVDTATLKRLNEIDNSIVQLVADGRGDEKDFRKKLAELTEIVSKNGRPLDPKEIVESDVILPGTDVSIEEARQIFRGEGIIPELLE